MVNPKIEHVKYDRQKNLQENYFDMDISASSNPFIIIGCGGVGFWAGIFLAMLGVKDILLVDKDKLEDTNINRIPVPQTFIGRKKVRALYTIIKLLRPCCNVNVLDSNAGKMSLSAIAKLYNVKENVYNITLLDCTDHVPSQNLIYEWFMKSFSYCKKRYVKIGYEGMTVGNYLEYQVWTTDDYRPGYRDSSANVVTSAIAAGLGILRVLGRSKDKNDINVNLAGLVGIINIPEDNEANNVDEEDEEDEDNEDEDYYDGDEDIEDDNEE